MKVLLFSDSHGMIGNIRKALMNEGRADYLIHCGDVYQDANEIENMAGCPCIFVAGNCDFYGKAPKEREFEIGGYKFLVTHGHNYGVNYGYDRLFYWGKERKANIVACGHTHVPHIEQVEDVWLINPGSISNPRTADRKCTYIVLTIDSFGDVHFDLKNV